MNRAAGAGGGKDDDGIEAWPWRNSLDVGAIKIMIIY